MLWIRISGSGRILPDIWLYRDAFVRSRSSHILTFFRIWKKGWDPYTTLLSQTSVVNRGFRHSHIKWQNNIFVLLLLSIFLFKIWENTYLYLSTVVSDSYSTYISDGEKHFSPLPLSISQSSFQSRHSYRLIDWSIFFIKIGCIFLPVDTLMYNRLFMYPVHTNAIP